MKEVLKLSASAAIDLTIITSVCKAAYVSVEDDVEFPYAEIL